MFKKYQHIHFVGIGGIGMSGIAQVLLTLGYKVSGSDLKKGSTTTQLARRGAKIFFGHKKENVGDAHVVVISSAVHYDNPEVIEAKVRGIPIVPRAEMLSELMRLKYGIAVAGTHGKTTTTSLIATILSNAGLDPTIVVGGVVNSFRTNAKLGKGDYLVAEADESDRSFLKLTPTIAVITNIDPEHMENYRDFQHVRETYASFANKVPFYGCVIACVDHPEVEALITHIERRVITYGIEGGDFTARNIRQEEGVIYFDAYNKGEPLGDVSLAIPGRHNVLNALATIAAAMELEVPFAKIRKGLSKFKGIERRFQVLSKKQGGPMVVTDYAHHPREIDAVLGSAADGWKERRVICVMQPHRYTRLSSLFNEFVEALARPDMLYVMPVYAAGEAVIEGATGERLFEEAKKIRKEKPTFFAKNKAEMFKKVGAEGKEGDIILFLGAGDIWKMGKEFAKLWH
ncbi:MAG: UDP-N-acetylmuramate--L-alanine ligase [Deltaproteobacteria bacterium CG11_big_fil_rev_8_21_14_0_20_49_13]|nr:MAG: UDP-N-acetylmuramate--L-alanine ligase [Deltaproteobacteria bacterium CG11_big_fil_rev_8_21_14_0_20_49_13]